MYLCVHLHEAFWYLDLGFADCTQWPVFVNNFLFRLYTLRCSFCISLCKLQFLFLSSLFHVRKIVYRNSIQMRCLLENSEINHPLLWNHTHLCHIYIYIYIYIYIHFPCMRFYSGHIIYPYKWSDVKTNATSETTGRSQRPSHDDKKGNRDYHERHFKTDTF